MRWPLLLILPLLALTLAACADPLADPSSSTSPSASTSPTSIGDNCLVGHWTLIQENIATPTTTLSGFSGARMTITAAGLETTDYNSAQTETGTSTGYSVVITRHGFSQFQDRTQAGFLIRAALGGSLIDTYIINGSAQPTQRVHSQALISLPYKCSATQLEFHVLSTNPPDNFDDFFNRTA